ncbi:MAG: helix-hairpin-helix domain-containing protein, partial [Infirmifilum sp.]
LYSHGYKSLIDLVTAREEDLAMIPGIGRALARSIKKQLSSEAEESHEEEEKIQELPEQGLDAYF